MMSILEELKDDLLKVYKDENDKLQQQCSILLEAVKELQEAQAQYDAIDSPGSYRYRRLCDARGVLNRVVAEIEANHE